MVDLDLRGIGFTQARCYDTFLDLLEGLLLNLSFKFLICLLNFALKYC